MTQRTCAIGQEMRESARMVRVFAREVGEIAQAMRGIAEVPRVRAAGVDMVASGAAGYSR